MKDPTLVQLRNPSGVRLSARLWANEAPRAVLVIAHGHGEHGGCYGEFAEAVGRELDLDILAFDFRGHGLSEGRRGVIRRYDDLLDDLAAWFDWVRTERSGLPVFVLGHSNGGLAAIRLLESRPTNVAGLILSNPSLRLIADAPAWKRLAGEVLLRVAPWVTLDTGIDGGQLTQAAESVATIENDPLRHQRISPPTYFGMVKNGPIAILEASAIRSPTLLVLGAADPVADPEAGRRFFDRLGSTDKTLRVFEGLRHEPLHEVKRVEVIAGIIDWLRDRLIG